MSSWPGDSEGCKSCGCSTSRRRHGGRGCCHRCYYFLRKREDAERWAFGDRQSLGKLISTAHADYVMYLSTNHTIKTFLVFKEAYISWINRKIERLKTTEECRNSEIDALVLERKFGEVLKLLNYKAEQESYASFLALHFDPRQMAIIFSLLDDIVELSVQNSDRAGFQFGADAVCKSIGS